MVTVDTEGTEKDVVSFGLFSEQWQVTIVWTGGSVGESFLRLLDKWNVDIICDTAGRSDVKFIFKNPVNHRILELSH